MFNRRRNRAMATCALESLDERIVLSASTIGAAIPAPEVVSPVYQPNGSSMDKLGQTLNVVYSDYYTYYMGGSHGTFAPTNVGSAQISGTSVGVDIHVNSSIALVTSELQGIGMKVTATSFSSGIIEGQLPIVDLPTVANDSHVIGLSPIYQTSIGVPTTTPSSLAKAGQALTSLYQQYETYVADGSQGTFTPTQVGKISIKGTSVGVDIRVGNSMALVTSELQGLGMKITGSNATLGIIEGQLPIAELPTVAGNSYVVGLSPIYQPSLG